MQRRIKGIILFVCCIIYLFVGIQPMYTKAAEDNDHATENPIWVDSPSIMGESGIVMEVSTGTILYEKNMHDIHYPASITKIMTVLLAIENCEMDEIVTVPPEAVYMEDKGSHIALDAGEQLTVEVMERIFGDNSDYSEETLNELKQVMLVPEQDRADISIYGKTGMGKANGIVVDAWFTGFTEGTEGKIYFCVYLGRTDGMNVSSSGAKKIAIQIVSDYYGQ